MAANWTAFVAGNVLTAAQLNGVVDNFEDVAIFNETQSSGTNGGSNALTYTKRTLNTTVVNNITGCSIASSVITLPAGTFEIYASAPAFKCEEHQIRLANTTDSTYSYGTSEYVGAGDSIQSRSFVSTVLTIAASKDFEIQHICGASKATNGFGVAGSHGNSEIFTQIKIRRVS